MGSRPLCTVQAGDDGAQLMEDGYSNPVEDALEAEEFGEPQQPLLEVQAEGLGSVQAPLVEDGTIHEPGKPLTEVAEAMETKAPLVEDGTIHEPEQPLVAVEVGVTEAKAPLIEDGAVLAPEQPLAMEVDDESIVELQPLVEYSGPTQTDELAADMTAGETEAPEGEIEVILKVDETTPLKAPPLFRSPSSPLAVY